ncbi:unnamed protein product [Nippostrongylus brasiliensis]|uniref:Protocadherin-like wing polarity protein stan (inferred by orthology to a D. melanogaster protein) n=1 Tax=Nippostrongylus brasiliensis TaxID=27835 RepID=A0A0N4YUQ1_NIPBR|nr:unnamed protein product [Nippostrongylus brasiliensis]
MEEIIGTTVLSVFARDLDAGANGELSYFLGDGEGRDLLSINTKSGVIQTAAPLDRETLALIRLDVIATDNGEPPRNSSALVEIGITDVNDNAPVFDQAPKFIASQKRIFLEESAAVGEEVGRVYAIDEDSGENGIVRYSLNGSQDFSIDPESGIIRTTTSLDRERTAIYVLEVLASDQGSPPLTSATEITVVVKDVNDNAPEFLQKEYNFTLSEETPRGSQIVVLKAEDKDAEQKIVYRIEQMDRDVVALIDLGEQGALLTLSGQLHSTDHLISLEVSATDQGGLQGRCRVNLIVEDINSAPYFTDQLFAVRVPEDSPLGFHVITIKVPALFFYYFF